MFKNVALALVTATGLGASISSAQTFGGRPDVGRPPIGPGPALSPYLNLNRGGLPAVNYFGLVRPQLETAQSLQQLQNQQLLLGSPLLNPYGVQPALLTTGHGAVFFNTSHYYPQRYPVGGSARR